MLLVVSAHTNETGMEEAIGPGFCGTSKNYFNANFHEKAHFVKADVAAPLWSSATALCPSRYASIRTLSEPTLR